MGNSVILLFICNNSVILLLATVLSFYLGHKSMPFTGKILALTIIMIPETIPTISSRCHETYLGVRAYLEGLAGTLHR